LEGYGFEFLSLTFPFSGNKKERTSLLYFDAKGCRAFFPLKEMLSQFVGFLLALIPKVCWGRKLK